MRETIHVVQPFERTRTGALMPRMPLQFQQPESAASRASIIAGDYAGVVAYSMEIDEAAGDYSDPTILFQAGDVPEL